MAEAVNQEFENLLKKCWSMRASAPEDAEKVALQAMSMCQSNSKEYARAMYYRGLCLMFQKQMDRAIAVLQTTLDAALKSDQTDLARKVHNSIGANYRELGQYNLAIQHYEDSARIARRDGRIFNIATSAMNLAEALFETGGIGPAEQIMAELFEKDLTDVPTELLSHLELMRAQLYLARENIDDAKIWLGKAAKKSNEEKYVIGQLRCAMFYGQLARLEKNREQAILRLTKVVDHPVLNSVGIDAIYAFLELAKCHYEAAEYQKGVDTLLSSFERVDLPDTSPFRLKVLDELVFGYDGLGDLQKSYKYLKQCRQFERSAQLEANLNLVKAIAIKRRYEDERRNRDIATQAHEATRQNNQRLTLLNDIAQQIARTLDYKELGKSLFYILEKHFDVHFISLATLNSDKKSLKFRFIFESGEFIEGSELSMDNPKSNAVKALKKGEPVILLNGVKAGTANLVGNDHKKIPQSVLFVPLYMEEEAVGVFSMQSPVANRFKEAEIQLMVAICQFISIAVGNIQSHEQVKRLNQSLSDEKKVIERTQAHIRHMAFHDSLTNLPNRQALEDFVEKRITEQQRPFYLMYIDLDAFKPINDTHGHKVGDFVLIETAKRIQSVLRARDLAARVGGDEFVIIVDDMNDEDLASFAARMIENLEQPMESTVGPVSISASIGTARFPDAGENLDTLMHSADQKMYLIKRENHKRLGITRA